jgi:hypothetical protein
MILFKVDDGEVYTVVANNKNEALALYVEDALSAHGEWPEEQPGVEAMDPSRAFTLTLDSGKNVTLLGHEWLSMYSHPQVLGCSLI